MSADTTPDTLRRLADWCAAYGVAPCSIQLDRGTLTDLGVSPEDIDRLRHVPGATFRRRPWPGGGLPWVAQDVVTLDGVRAQCLRTRAEVDADRPRHHDDGCRVFGAVNL